MGDRRLQFLSHSEAYLSEAATLSRPRARLAKAARDREAQLCSATQQRVQACFAEDSRVAQAAVAKVRDEVGRALARWRFEFPSDAPVVAANSDFLAAIASHTEQAERGVADQEASALAAIAARSRKQADSFIKIEPLCQRTAKALRASAKTSSDALSSALAAHEAAAARFAEATDELRADVRALVAETEAVRTAELTRQSNARELARELLEEQHAARARVEANATERAQRRRELTAAARSLYARTVRHAQDSMAPRASEHAATLKRSAEALDALETHLASIEQQRRSEAPSSEEAWMSMGGLTREHAARAAALDSEVTRLVEEYCDG